MMETIFMSSSIREKSISPCKQIQKQPSGNYYSRTSFISRADDQNKAPTNIIHGGLLFPPSTTSVSFSSNPYASLPITFYRNYQGPQPPLLPLPAPKSPHSSLPCRIPNMACSPTNRKINRNKDKSLTPKKSKTKKTNPGKAEERKKDDSKTNKSLATQTLSEPLLIDSIGPLGPDPKHLPKDVSKVLSSSPSTVGVNLLRDFDELSGSVFSLAPPPSSLPLPKFSLRQKSSCNAEAAGIDTGATDGLQRLLRLR